MYTRLYFLKPQYNCFHFISGTLLFYTNFSTNASFASNPDFIKVLKGTETQWRTLYPNEKRSDSIFVAIKLEVCIQRKYKPSKRQRTAPGKLRNFTRTCLNVSGVLLVLKMARNSNSLFWEMDQRWPSLTVNRLWTDCLCGKLLDEAWLRWG